MDWFRVEVRMVVTGALGVVLRDIRGDGEAQKALDVALAQVGTRCLSSSLRRTFYLGFACYPSWEEVHALFNSLAKKPVELETIERYRKLILKALRREAAQAPELLAWRKRYGRG